MVSSHPSAQWVPYRHVAGVVDLAGPRRDGSFVVAADGRLALLAPNGVVQPFARGANGYSTAVGPEPYIALAGVGQSPGPACTSEPDTIFAIEPSGQPGVMAVDAGGQARRFVNLPSGARPNGIAPDVVGRFGHRLLVSSAGNGRTTLFAVGCDGTVATITDRAPVFEGGIVVAPTSFGRFGGDLIAPDEGSGRVIAISPNGRATTLVRSQLPRGGDIGVESAGFLPASFSRSGTALVADRFTQGNPHPGTDNVLQLSGAQLFDAGVRPGDLLVASEGGAKTIAVRCATSCAVRHIADGPTITHGEGHIAFDLAPMR